MDDVKRQFWLGEMIDMTFDIRRDGGQVNPTLTLTVENETTGTTETFSAASFTRLPDGRHQILYQPPAAGSYIATLRSAAPLTGRLTLYFGVID